MSSYNCVWMKLFLTLNHRLQDSLGKRGEGLWHSGRTLLGNTSSYWFSLAGWRFRRQNFPRICASEPACRLSVILQFNFHISLFIFLFYVFIIRCSFGWRNTVCGDSLYKGKGCVTESRIFYLSVIKMHYLWKKSSNWRFDDSPSFVTNITSLFQSYYIRYFFLSFSGTVFRIIWASQWRHLLC